MLVGILLCSLFVLSFKIPVNNLSVMLGQSHCFLCTSEYNPSLYQCLAVKHSFDCVTAICEIA